MHTSARHTGGEDSHVAAASTASANLYWRPFKADVLMTWCECAALPKSSWSHRATIHKTQTVTDLTESTDCSCTQAQPTRQLSENQCMCMCDLLWFATTFTYVWNCQHCIVHTYVCAYTCAQNHVTYVNVWLCNTHPLEACMDTKVCTHPSRTRNSMITSSWAIHTQQIHQ